MTLHWPLGSEQAKVWRDKTPEERQLTDEKVRALAASYDELSSYGRGKAMAVLIETIDRDTRKFNAIGARRSIVHVFSVGLDRETLPVGDEFVAKFEASVETDVRRQAIDYALKFYAGQSNNDDKVISLARSVLAFINGDEASK